MRLKYGIRTLLVAPVLLASYIALYRALTVPEIIVSESVAGIGTGYRDPNFRFGGSLTKLAFLPATFVDQHVRPAFWNSYCTLDDVRTVTDYPWGYIDYIDGCANSLSLNANSSRSVDAAMEILTRSRDVTILTINGSCFVDSHLQTLQDIREFRSVVLLYTGVTRTAIVGYRQSNPRTDVLCVSDLGHATKVY